MALYSFEVRESEDGKVLGRVYASNDNEVTAIHSVNGWAADNNFYLSDQREVRELGVPAPDGLLFFNEYSV